MSSELSAPPTLSTPAEHLFEHVEPEFAVSDSEAQAHKRTDDELRDIYEIARTARDIHRGAHRRIGLQFPDTMLADAPWVAAALRAELASLGRGGGGTDDVERIYILADTSYSACCVDEIAAEHVDADVVVHYGRSCLSPTSRLPVIYVFTRHQLDCDAALAAFEQEFSDKQAKVVLVADVTYQDHVSALAAELRARGYTSILATEIVHDPSGRIPNRKVTDVVGADLSLDAAELKEHSVFHISTPPTALLLALSSRVKSLYIFPTSSSSASTGANPSSGPRLLSRRYARLLSLASAGVIGILVNTLSVSNYRESIDSIRKQIAAAGKKSYTVVVGKLNPAKLANFAEVDGWVVVGCWESSLVEDDASFYKPVITPFELDVALAGDENRVWTGEWWGGIEGVVQMSRQDEKPGDTEAGAKEQQQDEDDNSDDDESAPPEFDLRTGRLISNSRPMRTANRPVTQGSTNGASLSGTLALRPKAELATVNGVVSPGAEFLRSQRTWQGLGSDYAHEESTAIEEGRSGVARGYTVGNSERR